MLAGLFFNTVLLIDRVQLKLTVNGNGRKIDHVTNIELGIELFGEGNTIGYRMIGKIGKVRGTKNIFHLYSHGTFSPFYPWLKMIVETRFCNQEITSGINVGKVISWHAICEQRRFQPKAKSKNHCF